MLIFRDKRVRDNVDPIPNKMPQLDRGVYFAVQRALKSIWYGEPAPIQEAINHVRVEKDLGLNEYSDTFVKESLAQYVNLIIRKIVTLENDQLVKEIISWDEMRLRTAITRGLSNLETLRQEEKSLSNQIHKQEQIVRPLRGRKDFLHKQEKSLTNRLAQLEENEQHVQKELERINGLHPVEVDRCLEIVNALAKNANPKEQAHEGD